MTKSDLVARVAEAHPDLRQEEVRRVVDSIFDNIAQALSRGDRVELRGFGAFTVKSRAPYRGRNPRTGEAVSVGERRLPSFRAGKVLRQRINDPD
jgi:integration host factor subunit beta